MAELNFQQAVDALDSVVSEPKLNRERIKRAAADLVEVCDWIRDEAVSAVEEAGEVFDELNALRAAVGRGEGCRGYDN